LLNSRAPSQKAWIDVVEYQAAGSAAALVRRQPEEVALAHWALQREANEADTEARNAWLKDLRNLSILLRDIFGNPFRPVTFNPAWRTSDVLLLAQGIYDERAFDRMLILADALQDAGCDNEDILSHCRDVKQTHVRGCWVVDLVLGKE
jgi:hypothetical protein